MSGILTWEEIKTAYPNEWVQLIEFKEDEWGTILSGVLIHHHPVKKQFGKEVLEILESKNIQVSARLYTGTHRHPLFSPSS
jgi:hypothetical protein